MYFEEPKHDPVSSAFLTEAQKNALVIIIVIFKKEQKNKIYACCFSLQQYRNRQHRNYVSTCIEMYMQA